MGAFTHDRCASKVRQIQNFHMDDRGWADIAYSAVVCPHGYVYECRGPGKRTAANGTDAGNDEFYAVCYLGGEGDPFPELGKQGMMDARQWLMSSGIRPAGSAIRAHRSFKNTACPGPAIVTWINAGCPLQSSVKPAPVPSAPPVPPAPPEEKKMYFITTDPVNGGDWGTDGVTRFKFTSQEAKNEWAVLTGATRNNLSVALFFDIPAVAVTPA